MAQITWVLKATLTRIHSPSWMTLAGQWSVLACSQGLTCQERRHSEGMGTQGLGWGNPHSGPATGQLIGCGGISSFFGSLKSPSCQHIHDAYSLSFPCIEIH